MCESLCAKGVRLRGYIRAGELFLEVFERMQGSSCVVGSLRCGLTSPQVAS